MLKDIVSKNDEGRTPPEMELTKNQIQYRLTVMSSVKELINNCKKLEKEYKKSKGAYPEDDFELDHWLTIIEKGASGAKMEMRSVSTVPGAN